MYLDKDLTEDKVYQIIDQLNEKKNYTKCFIHYS